MTKTCWTKIAVLACGLAVLAAPGRAVDVAVPGAAKPGGIPLLPQTTFVAWQADPSQLALPRVPDQAKSVAWPDLTGEQAAPVTGPAGAEVPAAKAAKPAAIAQAGAAVKSPEGAAAESALNAVFAGARPRPEADPVVAPRPRMGAVRRAAAAATLALACVGCSGVPHPHQSFTPDPQTAAIVAGTQKVYTGNYYIEKRFSEQLGRGDMSDEMLEYLVSNLQYIADDPSYDFHSGSYTSRANTEQRMREAWLEWRFAHPVPAPRDGEKDPADHAGRTPNLDKLPKK